MESNSIIYREWLKYIDISLIDIYPIQFVNCDRLQKNDAVYIFDEVGSGKTISSGLMALDYLYNHPEKKVLVITTNALVKKSGNMEYGQFLRDWYVKLPFKQLGFTERIDIVNNHYKNIENKKEYGLIIVDEAHLFLTTDSLRHQCLKKLHADKIIFLTATPIKTSKDDLQVYVKLARNITGKEISNKWIEEINTGSKGAREIICSQFKPDYPVTRYFKDTIMSINVKGYQKRKARRAIPQLWEYGENDVSKNDVLLRKICERFEESDNNRFVIFTRFVEKEAEVLGAYLKNNGFLQYDKSQSRNIKSYKIITGDNAYELSDYNGMENLPTVLILTYQIAEQGVNLPGFNHVVNYHISAFPSALEQRFGRIDRMGKNGSMYDEIYMCFLLSKNYWDTNTWNFYCATATYLSNLISYLPSKNTILSEEIIERYSELTDHVENYIERINSLLSDEGQMDNIVAYFQALNADKIEQINVQCECDKILFEFIDENAIEFDLSIDEDVAKEDFRKTVKNTLAEYKTVFELNKDIQKDKYIEIIKALGDKIFYLNSEERIETLDAIEECGKHISCQDEFIEYASKFRNYVKLPIIVSKYLEQINCFFENKFIENKFHILFPYNGYRHIFEDIFTKIELDIEDKRLIIDNCDAIVLILPLFKLFYTYKTILQNMVYTQNGKIRVRFDFNPFHKAFRLLSEKVRQDTRGLGLSDTFFEKYFLNVGWKTSEIYTIEVDKSTNIAQVSNWYKLAYHYSRKEAACFMYKRTLCKNEKDNFYWRQDELIRWLATNYDLYIAAIEQRNHNRYEYHSAYKNAMDGEDGDVNSYEMLAQMGFYGEPEQPEIIERYENTAMQLHDILKKRDKEKGMHQSLFNHFIFNESGNYREYSMNITAYKKWKVFCNDLWTQGIIDEVVGWKYIDCTLNKIAKLPDEFHKYSLY